MKFSKEEKAMWLEDWKKSGKNAWGYAKENGLIPQTFCSWVTREEKGISGFAEVTLPLRQNPEGEILIEKRDLRIHIPVGLSARELSDLFESLRVAL